MMSSEAFLRAQKIIGKDEELYYPLWVTGVTKISAHIGLRKIQDVDGRLHLEIVVESDTTIDELEQNWHQILNARSKLAEVQGDDLTEYYCELLRAIKGEYIQEYEKVATENGFEIRSIKSKPSWRHLAMDANFDLLVYLIRISQPDHSELSHLADYLFRGLLKSFGFSEAEIDVERWTGLKLLASMTCPWDIRVKPIHREKMRLKVAGLKVKHSKNEDLILGYSTTQNLRYVRLLFLRAGDWERASELLINTFPKSYHIYESRLNARKSELLLSQSMKPLDGFNTDNNANHVE